MKYLVLAIHNFWEKCENAFANCQNASQILNFKQNSNLAGN